MSIRAHEAGESELRAGVSKVVFECPSPMQVFCLYTYIHTSTHTYIHTYIHGHMDADVGVLPLHIHTYMHTYTDIHTYIHGHMDTYIHYIHTLHTYITYIYIHIHASLSPILVCMPPILLGMPPILLVCIWHVQVGTHLSLSICESPYVWRTDITDGHHML